MYQPIPSNFLFLLPLTLALGWGGTRTALHIHPVKGSRGDRLTMFVVGWFPMLAWLTAFLYSLVERYP